LTGIVIGRAKGDKTVRIKLAAFLGVLLIPLFLRAEEPATPGLLPIPDYSGNFWDRSYLLGDLGGARTALADKGVQFDVDWDQYLQSVVSGGRDTGTDYGGHLDYLVHLDLMKMGLVPGGLVTIRAETRYGSSVNGIAGPILPVNTTADFPLTPQLDDTVPIALTDLNYTQFLSPKIGVFFGKLDTLDGDPNEFASGRGVSQFMNANFVFNSSLALRLPYSTLGAGVLFLPNQHLSIKGDVINSVDSSSTSGFADIDEGTSASIEADVQYRLGHLPGGMNLGGLYAFNQNFTKFSGDFLFRPGQGLVIPTKSDTWAVYWSGWQYLYVKDPDDKPINLSDGVADHEGIGLFARAGTDDQDTNPVEFSVSGGVGGRGLIPSRHNDTYGIGYYYTRFQENRFTGILGIDNNSQGGEAYYSLAITPAAHLTFDVQVMDSLLSKVDTSVILGMRLDLRF
jgi:porin